MREANLTQGEEIVNEKFIAENAETQELNSSGDALVQIDETAAPATESQMAKTKNEPVPPRDVPLLDDLGFVSFNDVVIAKLVPKQPLLEPKLELIGEELNQEETAILIHEKLGAWMVGELRQNFAPLYRLKKAIEFEPPVSAIEAPETAAEPIIEIDDANILPCETPETDGIEAEAAEVAADVTQTPPTKTEIAKPKIHLKPAPKALSEPAKEIARLVLENHGAVDRQNISAKIAALTPENRRELRINGMRFGRNSVYLPLLLKPKSARLSAILGFYADGDIEGKAPYLPPFGVTSFELPEGVSPRALDLIGFKNIGGRGVRLDIIDRIIDALFEAANLTKGPFELPTNIVSFLGTSNEIAENIVASLGWERITDDEGAIKWKMMRIRHKPPHRDFSKKPQGNDGQKSTAPNQSQQKPYEKRERNSDRPKFDRNKSRGNPSSNAPRDYRAGPKTIDADSPFAVLASLKASLENKKN